VCFAGVFVLAAALAAKIVFLLLVALPLWQATNQRAAAAVPERAGQGSIAEGDDAALKYAGGAVVA